MLLAIGDVTACLRERLLSGDRVQVIGVDEGPSCCRVHSGSVHRTAGAKVGIGNAGTRGQCPAAVVDHSADDQHQPYPNLGDESARDDRTERARASDRAQSTADARPSMSADFLLHRRKPDDVTVGGEEPRHAREYQRHPQRRRQAKCHDADPRAGPRHPDGGNPPSRGPAAARTVRRPAPPTPLEAYMRPSATDPARKTWATSRGWSTAKGHMQMTFVTPTATRLHHSHGWDRQ